MCVILSPDWYSMCTLLPSCRNILFHIQTFLKTLLGANHTSHEEMIWSIKCLNKQICKRQNHQRQQYFRWHNLRNVEFDNWNGFWLLSLPLKYILYAQEGSVIPSAVCLCQRWNPLQSSGLNSHLTLDKDLLSSCESCLSGIDYLIFVTLCYLYLKYGSYLAVLSPRKCGV